MCNHLNIHPMNCFIPPYISEKLMQSKDNKTVQQAVSNLQETSKLRSQRDFLSGLKGEHLAFINLASKSKKATLNMEVYTLKHGTDTNTATLVWKNGKATGKPDKDANNVISAGSATWDFYYSIFGRNSVDNLGYLLRHYVHYSKKYDNAMWDGSEMVYGDGDGKIFGSFTSDADVIGHELTHGVTQYESKLQYHNQSGALNESLSDVFGIMVKQRMLNQDVKTANWLIGENVLLGDKYALRSMKAPGTAFVNHPDLGTDPQPATMDKFVKLPDTQNGDWGGVHYNSGITNFAFYVAAFNIGGYAWEKTGQIWYKAVTAGNLKSTANFSDLKAQTIKQAEKLYGVGSKEAKAVQQGWTEAKV
jgi:Zn-dependent metalloprotease